MASSPLYPQPQADNVELDTALGWSYPGFPSQLKPHSIDNWIEVHTDTTAHTAQNTHGAGNLTGDWQASMLAISQAGDACAFYIVTTGYNGYYFRFDTNISVRRSVGGVNTTLLSVARNSAALVPTYCELQYTASTDTFELFEDGVSRGTVADATYEASAKTQILVAMQRAPGSRCRMRYVRIEDAKNLRGRPVVPALRVPSRRVPRNLMRSS